MGTHRAKSDFVAPYPEDTTPPAYCCSQREMGRNLYLRASPECLRQIIFGNGGRFETQLQKRTSSSVPGGGGSTVAESSLWLLEGELHGPVAIESIVFGKVNSYYYSPIYKEYKYKVITRMEKSV